MSRRIIYSNSKAARDDGHNIRLGGGVNNNPATSSSREHKPFALRDNTKQHHQTIKPIINNSSRRNVFNKSIDNHIDHNGGTMSSSLPIGSTGVDIPQAFADDEDARFSQGIRRARNTRRVVAGGDNTRTWIIPFCVLTSFVLVTGYFLVSHHERVLMDHQLVEQDSMMREREIDLSIRFDSKIASLEEENAKLQKKLSDEKELKILNQQLRDEKKRLEFQIKDGKDLHKDGGIHTKRAQKRLEKQIETLNKSNEQLTKYKKKMQENIQLMSKTALLEKFGQGPHIVDITVRFDSHSEREDQGVITIEMAPIDELPHAVYWFLEQVSRQLYDGCSFHRNAGHVIQGGPAPNFLSKIPNPQLSKRFRDAGFSSILFQEYSETFPHKKYTLGYAGRPGGPDFYISMQDNSKIHGPGGQSNYEDPNEADSCFAQVIDGFDVVDRMHKSPIKPGDYKALESNIAIVSMRIKK